MSIASQQAAVRASRSVEVLSRRPWAWRVQSTDGTYFHLLRWVDRDHDVVCDACLFRYGRGRCWARKVCLTWLRAEMVRRRAEATGADDSVDRVVGSA